MTTHPLAEVFGFPTDNLTPEAERYRNNRLCPFNNTSPNCTKSSAENPLGVCSVFGAGDQVIVTCPVRFREEWRIATDAAEFFFPSGARWTALTEVQLSDRAGKSAGNIDVVLLSYDPIGRILDYGALEVQAVYISGNVRTPFEHYMEDPAARANMDWRKQRNYPRPDYLSSSRKRLAPQLIYKGGILNAWNRKMAVALNTSFYNTLPALEEVERTEADIAWLIYDLQLDTAQNRYRLTHHKTAYTRFEPALLRITRSEAGDESLFVKQLQTQLNRRLGNGEAHGSNGELRP
ncbi:MAG TPA: NotI family restriction endonuclease [Chthonomonadaceae bacterium]|nr:NotI family restriction endonuclease [Chthonomonadaceae bacterium]